MGAAASSEAALKRTLIAALGPGSSSTYARLPRDPRKWNVQQVGIWLREQEMPALVRTMESNNVDGRMLLDDCSDEDIANLVPFPPLRRKLTRSIDSLRQQSAEVQGPVSADMSEVSAQRHHAPPRGDHCPGVVRGVGQAACCACGRSATRQLRPGRAEVWRASRGGPRAARGQGVRAEVRAGAART